MVGRSYSLTMRGAESEEDLRIALYETKEDVQRLREELDAEREASDSSASEAMSMILRLQEEKAALVMEASQYRRMAEERMSHAELSLELLEDLSYQKEVEIKNLESRLYAYKCKLLSLGCRGTDDDDHSSSDMRCCDDRSQTPSPEPFDTDVLVPVEKEVIEQSLDSSRRRHQEKNLDLYWDQIKKLDEQLKELTDFKDSLKTKNGEITGRAFAASSSNIQDVVPKVCKKSSKRRRNRSVKRDHAKQGGFNANDAEYQAELQRLRERVEQLERATCNAEPQTSEVMQEEKLSYVQAEMKNSRTEKLPPCYDSAIVSVQEAMLYFWL